MRSLDSSHATRFTEREQVDKESQDTHRRAREIEEIKNQLGELRKVLEEGSTA